MPIPHKAKSDEVAIIALKGALYETNLTLGSVIPEGVFVLLKNISPSP
jgi:hypothetical protein